MAKRVFDFFCCRAGSDNEEEPERVSVFFDVEPRTLTQEDLERMANFRQLVKAEIDKEKARRLALIVGPSVNAAGAVDDARDEGPIEYNMDEIFPKVVIKRKQPQDTQEEQD